MIPERILVPESVICTVSTRSKKHCLEILSELLARRSPNVPGEEVFSRLVERERLGSTGLGNGVAFPHCRLAGIDDANGALLKLSEAVEFESPDAQPVDLIFGLLVPEEITDSHRDTIAAISRILTDTGIQARMRKAATARQLYEAFRSAAQIGEGASGVSNLSRGS